MTEKQMILSVAVIALVTAAIRFLPFLVFGEKRTPGWITRLGETLPYAVMGMLVVYCLKDVSFGTAAGFLPALIGVVVVAGSYLWRKNTLMSIVLGTAVYMMLVQFIFV